MDEVDDLIERYGHERVVEAVRPLLTPDRITRINDVLSKRLESVTVVLENLYDSHNGAAVIRSAESLGVQAIHIVDGERGTFEASDDVTIGSHKWVDLTRHNGVASAMIALKSKGFVNVVTSPSATKSLTEIDPALPIALWFGNERDGVSTEVFRACDEQIRIPMYGFSQSFNLSVSVALCLRDACERRRQFLGRDGDLEDSRKTHLQARWLALGMRGISEIVERYVSKMPSKCGVSDTFE